MPQDGSNNYKYPDGTRGIPNQTISSGIYNAFLDDLVGNDLNWPRPIHRGGTGADNADQALVNFHGEKATQLVANYDSHLWLPGSFYSATSATGSPIDGHAFAGVCYSLDPLANPPTNLNVVVEARDQSETASPGTLYVREKRAGVWSAWVGQAGSAVEIVTVADARYVNVAGDTMLGALAVNSYVDASSAGGGYKLDNATVLSRGAPLLSLLGTMSAIHLGNSSSTAFYDTTLHVFRTQGGGLNLASLDTSGLTLTAVTPTAAGHATSKQYVDAADAVLNSSITSTNTTVSGKVAKAGDTMSGLLTVSHFNSTSTCLHLNPTNGGYTGRALRIVADRTGTTGFYFLTGESGGATDTEFSVNGAGGVHSDAGTAMSTPADYADMFEWADLNKGAEDRRGLSVVLVGDKVRPATAEDDPDDIIGVVSSNPTVLGRAAWNRWHEKYERDQYGTTVHDANGERKLNPNFDPDKPYIPRIERSEWEPIGLVGVLRLRKGQPVGSRWRKMFDVNDEIEEWLIR